MKKLLAAALLSAALLSGHSLAADVAPDLLARQATEDVLKLIRSDKDIQAGNQRKLLALVEARVLPHFNFERMTQLAVGKFWREAGADQRTALMREFKTLLVRTYSASLAAYKDQDVVFKPFRMAPEETDVLVKTEIQPKSGPAIPVDYRLARDARGWRVYDVQVDGVSLVTNYRTSFAAEIRNGGIDGLIRALKAKNAASGAAK